MTPPPVVFELLAGVLFLWQAWFVFWFLPHHLIGGRGR